MINLYETNPEVFHTEAHVTYLHVTYQNLTESTLPAKLNLILLQNFNASKSRGDNS